MSIVRTTAMLLCLPPWTASVAAAEPFDQTFDDGTYRFRIQSDNSGSINSLTVTPSGLAAVNRAETVALEGTVTGAELADLDANGFPEIYVFITSAGSGSYGSLVAYAVNNGKSMSSIYLPPLEDDPQLSAGYMGHDEFAVVENVLARRFPLYRDGDSNAAPSGQTRQVQYRLVAGEAGWLLRVDRVDEF